MLGFQDYQEFSKIFHVLYELLGFELPEDSLRKLSEAGVKTFDDFIHFCLDKDAIHALFLASPSRKERQVRLDKR